MNGSPVLGKEAASGSWLLYMAPQEQPQLELRPMWSCGVLTETVTGEYLWWVDWVVRSQTKILHYFSFMVFQLFFFLTCPYICFSLGKHFEKEKDVRGVPEESFYFRWDDLFTMDSRHILLPFGAIMKICWEWM